MTNRSKNSGSTWSEASARHPRPSLVPRRRPQAERIGQDDDRRPGQSPAPLPRQPARNPWRSPDGSAVLSVHDRSEPPSGPILGNRPRRAYPGHAPYPDARTMWRAPAIALSNPTPTRLTRGEALNLAVWLVALADGKAASGDSEFAVMLQGALNPRKLVSADGPGTTGSQTSWKRSRIPNAHENGRGLDRGCPAALFNPAVEWPPGNLAARWSTSTGAPTQHLLQYINPHSMASLFGLLYPSSRPGHDLIRFFAAHSCTLRENRSDPACGVAPVLVSTALARATSGTRTLDFSFTKAALYQLS